MLNKELCFEKLKEQDLRISGLGIKQPEMQLAGIMWQVMWKQLGAIETRYKIQNSTFPHNSVDGNLV